MTQGMHLGLKIQTTQRGIISASLGKIQCRIGKKINLVMKADLLKNI